jgi:hypothetical protein
MATQQIRRRVDVVEADRSTFRLRLLAPLRYLSIQHVEKFRYDVILPVAFGVAAWGLYLVISPKPPLFGESGLLRFARDLLVMAVPFMVGALAAVSMGSPGTHLDRRPIGAELILDNEALTLRQFLCYLLGYLCFVGLLTLVAVVAAGLFRDAVLAWTVTVPTIRMIVWGIGSLGLSLLLSFLSVTVLWSLYFLTDIANRRNG